LALARKYGVPIFEDECYADLIWAGERERPASLYAMDPQQVIHIGSFSKTLAPAVRLGYVVAVPEVMSRLVACSARTTVVPARSTRWWSRNIFRSIFQNMS